MKKKSMSRVSFRRIDNDNHCIYVNGNLYEALGYGVNIAKLDVGEDACNWFDEIIKSPCDVGLSVSADGLEVFFSYFCNVQIRIDSSGTHVDITPKPEDELWHQSAMMFFKGSILKVRSDGKVTCHVTLPCIPSVEEMHMRNVSDK